MTEQRQEKGRLPNPVGRVLQDQPLDRESTDRVWNEIDEHRRRRSGPLLIAWGAAALATVVLLLVLLVRPETPTTVIPAKTVVPGPLTAENESLEVLLEQPNDSVARLSDGSKIKRGSNTKAVSLINTGREVRLLLEVGRIDLDVVPNGPRRWSIECGIATVEVVGTKFSVERQDRTVTVSVERGVVLVKSNNIENGARRLEGEESITITKPSGPEPVEPKREAELEPKLKPVAEQIPTSNPKPVKAFLRRADRARSAGKFAEAKAILEELVETHPDDPQAGLAMFTIGKLELDQLNQPKRAVAAFHEALKVGIPGALEEDLWVRLVKAHAAANDEAHARETARAYRQRFPDGRRSKEIERWIEE